MSKSDEGYRVAFQEALSGLQDGGIPVGSAIVSRDGKTILGRGRNMRIQNGSPILHGETAAFASAPHLPQADFAGSTIYTTLSPCPMCAGAMILFKCAKVVIGDSKHMNGREELLRQHGIEVVLLEDKACEDDLMGKFLTDSPEKWEFE